MKNISLLLKFVDETKWIQKEHCSGICKLVKKSRISNKSLPAHWNWCIDRRVLKQPRTCTYVYPLIEHWWYVTDIIPWQTGQICIVFYGGTKLNKFNVICKNRSACYFMIGCLVEGRDNTTPHVEVSKCRNQQVVSHHVNVCAQWKQGTCTLNRSHSFQQKKKIHKW